ncbi:MAG TPA: hypothetical protein PK801_04925 [Aggregatilineales bacterium]|nr:hypothetical protein [Chloroflexota bacterium]HOA23420.1 hypothetical protein [Aggregatilineales bacterium]HPV06166.1 hypothetical protein [Aggregatilineales bacterium]HQA67642.1 hypothetical protein [Aggregatilineales bacterium]HQE17992.1 hypothetical protein [Aggregatilineales bacterium]
MQGSPLKINWSLLLAYGFVAAGLTFVALFFSIDWYMDGGIALTFLFVTLGATAFLFYAVDRGRGWRWLGITWWIGAVLTIVLHMMMSGSLPPALGLAGFCFAAAGLVLFLSNRRKDRREQARELEWEALGTRQTQDVDAGSMTAAEYETLMARQRRGG